MTARYRTTYRLTRHLPTLALLVTAIPVSLAQKPRDPALDKISSSPLPPTQNGRRLAGRLEDIAYKVPAGWKSEEPGPTTRTFTSPDREETKQALILMALTPPLEDDFRAAFDRTMAGIVKGKKLVQSSPVQASRSSEGYDILQQALVVEANGGGRTLMHYVGANVHGRMAMIGFLAVSQETVNRYQPVWNKFLEEVDLPARRSQTAVPSRPSARHTGGIWAKSPQEIARTEDVRRQPETVSGAIYDADGKPFRLPGCRVNVHIWGTTANGHRIFYDTEMDGNGRYALRVPHGLYVVSASAYMPLNGKTLCVGLDILDGRPQNITVDSTPGIVKDFGLKLWGPKPDGKLDSFAGYNGGGIYVTDGANWKEAIFGSMERRYPQGTYVEVTLTPRSRLIDGSMGQTLTLRCDLKRMQSGHTHPNIPLAVYTATARIVTPDGRARRLKVALLPDLNYVDAMEITFEPRTDDHEGGPAIPNLFVLD